jgi:hypothetical protein
MLLVKYFNKLKDKAEKDLNFFFQPFPPLEKVEPNQHFPPLEKVEPNLLLIKVEQKND